jgi:hypothetical protein
MPDALFSPGEQITGRVIAMTSRFATLEIRSTLIPLEKEFISWTALKSTDEVLSLGDRVEVMVFEGREDHSSHRRYRLWPRQVWNGRWASRLPLLDDPWPSLEDQYPEGTVVEVEMIDYVNWYIARVRLPDGLVVELRTNDIHLRTPKSSSYVRTLYRGERFKVVFRRLYRPGGWVERHLEKPHTSWIADSGLIGRRLSAEKLTLAEQEFLAKRECRSLRYQ